MELVSDAGIYSDQWTQLTQGSRISCQVTEDNMHKTNIRFQALAEGSNYLCNTTAAETIFHVATEAVYYI